MIASSSAVATVPLSSGFLCLAKAMQMAYGLYQLESTMAAQLGLDRPASAISRVEELFRGSYSRAVTAVGLERSGKILCVLLETILTEEMCVMDPADFARQFRYDPSAHEGRGAVVRI